VLLSVFCKALFWAREAGARWTLSESVISFRGYPCRLHEPLTIDRNAINTVNLLLSFAELTSRLAFSCHALGNRL